MSDPSTPPLLVSVKEAAAALCISRGMVYKLIQTGALRTVTIGDRRLVAVAEVERIAREGAAP